MRKVLIYLLVLLSNVISVSAGESIGRIYIGDSRTVGLEASCKISEKENHFVVAKGAQGYRYLVNTALPEIEKIKEENKHITKWFLILNMGINDLNNLEKYVKLYTELSKSETLILVSVNPTRRSRYHEGIVKINEAFKNIKGTVYLDLYNTLLKEGYESKDGIHYSRNTNKYIFNEIEDTLNILEEVL